MRWLIVYLVAVAATWLLVANDTWRRALLGVITVVFAVLMVMLALMPEDSEQQSDTARQFDEVRQQEAVRYGALKPSDIAIVSTGLANPVERTFDSAGKVLMRPDLYRWELKTVLENTSESVTAGDITLRLRLFSCPAFFDTPQVDVTPRILDANCSMIGSRSIGLNGVNLQPGKRLEETRTVRFADQPEPRNPRYWLSVQSVAAAAGN
jgi:hypothetical protein